MNKDNSNKPLIVSLSNPESRSQLHSHAPLFSSQKLGWKNVNFDYFQYGNCETPIHVTQHHAIGLILQPAQVERKLDGVYQRENTNIGSVAIIPAQVEHWSAWKDIGQFIVFSLLPKAIAEIAPETINPDRVELIPTFAKYNPDHLIHGIGMAIKAHLETEPNDGGFYIEHLTSTLSAHLLQNYCTVKPNFKDYSGGLSPQKLKQAINYINDNLEESIKLKDIANLLDISQYYFSHLFRQSTGIAPYHYVIQQRIAKAKQLLKQSQLPLADIAFACGFSSQSQMTLHFRKLTGMTPKKYRDRD